MSRVKHPPAGVVQMFREVDAPKAAVPNLWAAAQLWSSCSVLVCLETLAMTWGSILVPPVGLGVGLDSVVNVRNPTQPGSLQVYRPLQVKGASRIFNPSNIERLYDNMRLVQQNEFLIFGTSSRFQTADSIPVLQRSFELTAHE
ncbi:hypothetical protein AVEN_253856-1 [Araneus ventricosus]|uniref:Uncharacterized protein n=1 Tax=Araneus ventricosus TaxID=182803 RepID=A0A4Y2R6B2_ARAVE|nr:hypothetical protein AVEN_253856-1 [Araneus ventricosus]